MWLPESKFEAPELFVPYQKPRCETRVDLSHKNAPDYYWGLNDPSCAEEIKGQDAALIQGAEFYSHYVKILTDKDCIDTPLDVNLYKGAVLIHYTQTTKDNSSAYICEASWGDFGLVWVWGTNELWCQLAGDVVKVSHSVTAGDEMAIVLQWDSVTEERMVYINGDQVMSSTSAFNGGTASNLVFGSRAGSDDRYVGGNIYCCAYWDGRWPDNAMDLSRDPYQFMVPK